MKKKLNPTVNFSDVDFFNTQASALNKDEVPTVDTNKDEEQYTTQCTTRDTVKPSFQIPSKSEAFSKRLVANVTPTQKAFVQKMSKKFENESSFVRFMIDRFMKDIEVK